MINCHFFLASCCFFLFSYSHWPSSIAFGNGWFGGGLDQDQVEAHLPRSTQGGAHRHDLYSGVGKDGTYFGCADRFIYVLPDPRPASLQASWIHPRRPERASLARTNGDSSIATTKQ